MEKEGLTLTVEAEVRLEGKLGIGQVMKRPSSPGTRSHGMN